VRQCRLPLLSSCLNTDAAKDMSTTENQHGELDGRPVTWLYRRAGNDQEGSFSWADRDGNVECKYSA